MWVDTHCHLFGSSQPPQDLLARAVDAGVDWVVCPGIDAASSRRALWLAGDERVLATAGLHPHYAELWVDQRDDIAALASEASAVGECGLDFYRDLAPRDRQIEAFREQLQLAVQLDKPVIVHCRDAFEAVYDAVEGFGDPTRTVLHCWTGGPKWTKRFADLGVTFSFAGPLAFETGDTVRRGAAVAPRERTMVETDTPYLSPPPYRGEDNEPARVGLVGAALAAVWDLDAVDVANMTTATAERIFRG